MLFYSFSSIFCGAQFNPLSRYMGLFSCNRWCLVKAKGTFHLTSLLTPPHPENTLCSVYDFQPKLWKRQLPCLQCSELDLEHYVLLFIKTLYFYLKDEIMKLTKTYSQIPFLAAMWRGNRPSLLALLASAPWDKRNSTIGTCPFLQAS